MNYPDNIFDTTQDWRNPLHISDTDFNHIDIVWAIMETPSFELREIVFNDMQSDKLTLFEYFDGVQMMDKFIKDNADMWGHLNEKIQMYDVNWNDVYKELHSELKKLFNPPKEHTQSELKVFAMDLHKNKLNRTVTQIMNRYNLFLHQAKIVYNLNQGDLK